MNHENIKQKFICNRQTKFDVMLLILIILIFVGTFLSH